MRYLILMLLFGISYLYSAIEVDVDYLKQQLAHDSRNVPYRLILAKYYLQNSALSEAEKMLEEIKKIDPENRRAALLSRQLGKLQRLQKALPGTTLTNPYEIEKGFDKLIAQNRCDRLLSAYGTLKEMHLPLSQRMHLDAAFCYAGTGDFKNALLLRKIHDLPATDTRLALDTLLALHRGETAGAQQRLQRLRTNYPDSPLVAYTKKRVRTSLHKEGASLAKKAFTQNSLQALHDYVYLLGQQQKPAEAIDAVKTFLKKNPQNRDARILLAKLYYWNGDLERAFHTLYPVRKSSHDARRLYADILYERGDYTHALYYLPETAQLEKDPNERYRLLKRAAFAYAYSGKEAKAQNLFQKLLAQNPHDEEIVRFNRERATQTLLQKAVTAHRLKAYDKALRYYQSYYNKTKDPKIAKEIAEIHYMQEQYDKSLPWFAHYLEKNPHDSLIRFHYATALEKTKQYQKAIAHFARVAKESRGELHYLAAYHEAYGRMQLQEDAQWRKARERLHTLKEALSRTAPTEYQSLKKYVATLTKTADGPVQKPTYFKDIVLTEGAKKNLDINSVFSNVSINSTTHPTYKTLLHITPSRQKKHPHLELHTDYADDTQTRYLNHRIRVANLMVINGIRYSAAARRFDFDFQGGEKAHGRGFSLEAARGKLSLSLGITQFEAFNTLEPKLTWSPVFGSHTLYAAVTWQNGIFQNYNRCMLTDKTHVLHAALYDTILLENLSSAEIGLSLNAYEDRNINLYASANYPIYTTMAGGIEHGLYLNENIDYNTKTDLCYLPARLYDTTYLKYRPKMEFENGSLQMSLGGGYSFQNSERVTSYGVQGNYTLRNLVTFEVDCESTQSSFTTEDIKYCNFNIIQEW